MLDEVVIKGVGAAPGQALGYVVLYHRPAAAAPRKLDPASTSIEQEQALVRSALAGAGLELEALAAEMHRSVGPDEGAIFEAQALMCADPTLADRAAELVEADGLAADSALLAACEEQAQILASLEDPYLAERAVDLRDVGARAARIARGEPAPTDLSRLPETSVVAADDLTPSETARLDRSHLLGIALSGGGPTSHVAVIARSLGVPLVCGLGTVPEASEAAVLVDGDSGLVVLNPSGERLAAYKEWQTTKRATVERQAELRHLPAMTLDGHRVRLVANAGSVEDAVQAAVHGAEGIGLLRTEFLFMDHLPSEEAQVEAYSRIGSAIPGHEVIVRSMDLGGDKPPPYLDIAPEANPFLGWRGLRLALDIPEMLQTQIRAVLRASAGGAAYIMFPMVSTLEEFRRARDMVEKVRLELEAEDMPSAEDVQVGIMVEVPSAALMSRQLAAEAHFFSIGTNDLTQYTMAADRGEARVAHLYSPIQPAVLQLINMTVESAHAEGRWVGMCGEAAGNPAWTELWLGLGLDELSMAPAAIPEAKEIIRNTNLRSARSLARHLLRQPTLESVEYALSEARAGSKNRDIVA